MLERARTYDERNTVFIEEVQVTEGVKCKIHSFQNDSAKDLGVVTVKAGHKTPLQKILTGDETIEGYVRGAGSLAVISGSKQHTYIFAGKDTEIVLGVGDIMQWHAATDEDLVFYEICTPPYEDGRFENLV